MTFLVIFRVCWSFRYYFAMTLPWLVALNWYLALWTRPNDFPYFFLIPSLLPVCFSTTGFMRGRAVTLPLQVRLWLKLSMALQGNLLTRSPCRFLSKTLFTLEAGIWFRKTGRLTDSGQCSLWLDWIGVKHIGWGYCQYCLPDWFGMRDHRLTGCRKRSDPGLSRTPNSYWAAWLFPVLDCCC